MKYWIILLLFTLRIFLVDSSPPSRETSPAFDVDSFLNLPSDDEELPFPDHQLASPPKPITDQRHMIRPPPLDRKTRKREYMKLWYQKKMQQNPNFAKKKYQRRLEILSQKTDEEKRADKDKRKNFSKKAYHDRKSNFGHGTKQLQDIQQIKQKINDKTATPEDRLKHHAYFVRKRLICSKSRYKRKVLREASQASERESQDDCSPDRLDEFDWTSMLSIPEEGLSPESEHRHDKTELHTTTSKPVHDILHATNKEDRKLKKAAYCRSYRRRPEIIARSKRNYEKSKVAIRERSRDEYRRRKERLGYGRIQNTTYSQLGQKVKSKQATKEELKQYLELKEKKSIYNRRYRQKQQQKELHSQNDSNT
ncbi:uncharacterized protein FA14DRAFT_181929 [Meira miltonrushii]|uniref:FMR1-interacting protein 1 conserved domain-containing protein n=1 Tax=Meira miltonrushii TaxID=1280837 RepID=A0A316V3A4_9BASI|nr:uncharacterized protein FA14DRAFT_181929 [Meira miltonrushii]PWN32010.1 hypothetical protein FA14DRAFT_181929 [Meira miltonrushii]